MTTPRRPVSRPASYRSLAGLLLTPLLATQLVAQSPALFDAPLLVDAQEELALLGDVDLDGDVDAIGFVSVGGTLIKSQARVFWNDGLGNLAAGPVLPLPTDVGNQVAYADVDGDGQGDLLVTNSLVAGTPGLRVFPGLPGGLFAAPVFLPLPGNPIGLRTGDTTGDGIADVCVLCGAGNGWQLRWYAGDPARVFPLGTPLNLSLDYRPALVVLDADGDGDRDAAMLNLSQNTLEIVVSNGLVPTAGPVVPLAAAANADLAVVDLDGDGDDDLVAHSSPFGVATLLPLLHQPGGVWVAAAPQPLGNADAGGMYAGDWDGDGDQDLLLRGFTDGGVTPSHTLAWLRNQAGTFVATRVERVFAAGDTSYGAGVADLDADGDRDFVDARALRFNHPQLLTAPLAGPNTLLRDWDDDGDLDARIESTKSLAKNDGSGLLTTQPGFWPAAAPGTTFGTPIAVADFDGDGLQEALAPRLQLTFPSQFLGVHRLEADGDDRLVDQGVACTNSLSFGLPLDVDGDGDLDLVTSQGLVVQQPLGTFTLQPQAFAGYQPNTVADLDGDGDEDVLLADGTLSIAVLWRTAPAAYTLDVVMPASGNTVIPVYIAVADLDDDGDLDLAAARHAQFFSPQKQVELWTNQAGAFTLAQTLSIDGRPLAGDVDGDGTTDLVVTTSHAVDVLRRVGPGLAYAPARRFSQFGGFALADIEQDGDLDLFGSSRVANQRFVGAAAGARQQYGIGGGGTGGRRPLLSAIGAIRPGLTCELRLRRALGGMPVALFFGASAIDIPNLLPGVTGYVDNLFASVLLGLGGPIGVPGAGTMDVSLALPPTAALLDVYVHALVLDAAGPIGLLHSNATLLRIGL